MKKYLLDTQTWLWLQTAPKRINTETLNALADTANDLLLSAASSWEISIKYALGKLPLPRPPATYLPERMRANGVVGVPITHRHTTHVATLPHHHGDPFDRLIIAQAQLDDLTVVTADRMFDRYDVTVQWSN